MSKFSFEDIGAVVATFAAGSGVKGGQVVKLTGNGAVDACAAGDSFCGVALEPRKGGAAVQVKGFAAVPYTGTLTVGWTALVADGQGGVKTNTTGVQTLVVSVEETDDEGGAGMAVVCL